MGSEMCIRDRPRPDRTCMARPTPEKYCEMLLNIPYPHSAITTVKCQRNAVRMAYLYIIRLAYLILNITMSTDKEFRDKMRARVDAVGPCCSCLVIIVALALAFFAFVIR